MKADENLDTNNLEHLQSNDPKLGILSITSEKFLIVDAFFFMYLEFSTHHILLANYSTQIR